MRLDVYLADRGYATSRTEAKGLIQAGAVQVAGKQVCKPSYDVDDDTEITVEQEMKKYVSRGGYKLEAALKEFDICVSGRLAIDIGASSGGFTDCLLQYGAKHVIAVDSGREQLTESIKNDSRVTSIESYNARYMKPEDFTYVPDLAVMDVSFISATCIISALYEVLAPESDFICLIKPQFEVGRSGLGKGGIVRDDKIRRSAIDKVLGYATACGFEAVKTVTSPIKGGDGNIEYLAHFRKRNCL